MNSLAKVFNNFREFYSEINGATLTGAIDVIVIEQPDGSFMCSPFHVRFGKLGVLRSREKVVDIEINGEPVSIHMKLGESGEAFFVEECFDDDEEVPDNLATSPIPLNPLSEFVNYEETVPFSADTEIQIPKPRRNSIDLSKETEETEKKFENQISDFSHRRHTDNTIERRDLSVVKKEYTTLKIRQEWAEHEETFQNLGELEDISESTITTTKQNNDAENEQSFRPIATEKTTTADISIPSKNEIEIMDDNKLPRYDELKLLKKNSKLDVDTKDEKKKRRKKSSKKKKSTRKNSASSSADSIQSKQPDVENEIVGISNNTSSSTDESPISDETVETVLQDVETKENEEKHISMNARYRDMDIHFFSDTEIANSVSSPQGSRPGTPIQSDTEFEVSQREKSCDSNVMTNSASWKWGELPTHPDDIKENITDDSKQAQRISMLTGMFSFMKQSKKMRKSVSEGLYLSDLNAEGMDPEVAALYLQPNRSTALKIRETNLEKESKNFNEEDRESGNGTSLPQSPNSMEAAKNSDSDYEEGKNVDTRYPSLVAMSLCGGLENGGPLDEDFDRHMIKYADVCQNPSIFSSPNLVVRLNCKYFSWAAACPIVMTMITFQKSLPSDTIDTLMNIPAIKSAELNHSTLQEQEPKRPYYNFFGLLRRQTKSVSETSSIPATPNTTISSTLKDHLSDVIQPINAETQTSRSTSPETKDEINIKTNLNLSLQSDNSESLDKTLNDASISLKTLNDKFKKTLRLSTDQIECLNLKDGMNEVVFSVTTAYQGTTRCKCYLFKWKYNDKVVISDIDGTITKSDVLGHILPMVGKDWAQIGVAQLFSKIEENGYKLLYLSARAIGQSRATREYLRSIRQGDVKLPDGPLLLNPTSLISAFHREVIERKPEEFKIACLSDIQALFPDKNPFYAGYGNRINDVWAYRAVGIPIHRIFTINTKGELRHELTQTFQSTYCSMAYIVDQLFPPIHLEDEEPSAIEYSNFNYWRDPVCDIDIILDENLVPNLPLHNNNKTLAPIPEN